jgi:uncharacterized membrane protein
MPPGVKKSIVLEAKKFASMTHKHKYSNKKLHFNAAGHLAQDVCNQLIVAFTFLLSSHLFSFF